MEIYGDIWRYMEIYGDIWRYMEIWDAAGSLGVVGVGCVSCRPGTAISISAPQLHCGGWWYLYPA
jgi:hypothetical protein